mmetsp:Transcript_44973/g.117897  ORF Transcript_44973/g.117897 Transcript_44973/m.117897 type:complete len:263 (-) Transcript_44973:374-1162(-)
MLRAQGIWSIVDYHMFPWGNAYYNSSLLAGCPSNGGGYGYDRGCYPLWAEQCNETATAPELCWNGTKLCQHGPAECAGDSLEACVMSVYPSPTLYTQFVYCFEAGCLYNGTDPFDSTCNTTAANIEHCADFAGISAAPVLECFNDEARVEALDLQMAKATAALGTSKQGTPWVLINGVPLDDVDDLLPTVCDAWAAENGEAPPGCSSAAAYDWATWQEGATLAAGLGGGLLLGTCFTALCYRRMRKQADTRRAPLLDLAGAA